MRVFRPFSLLVLVGASFYLLSSFLMEGRVSAFPKWTEISGFRWEVPPPLRLSEGRQGEPAVRQMNFTCDNASPCPHIADYPKFPISKEWLAKVQSELEQVRTLPSHPQSSQVEKAQNGFLELESHSGEKIAGIIGDYNSYYASYYLHFNSGRFILLPESFLQLLRAPYNQILEDSVFEKVLKENIQQVVLSGGALSPILLQRDDKSSWFVNGAPGDGQYIESFLGELLSLRFISIHPSTFLKKTLPYLSFSLNIIDLDGAVESRGISVYYDKMFEDAGFFAIRDNSPESAMKLPLLNIFRRLPKVEHFLPASLSDTIGSDSD